MQIEERCHAIEECYEFMLAYAAQGPPSDKGSHAGGQIREFLSRAADAVRGLAESYATVVLDERLEPAEQYEAFFDVLNRDARDSLAAIELVLVNPRSARS
jgi:hypothetical protein